MAFNGVQWSSKAPDKLLTSLKVQTRLTWLSNWLEPLRNLIQLQWRRLLITKSNAIMLFSSSGKQPAIASSSSSIWAIWKREKKEEDKNGLVWIRLYDARKHIANVHRKFELLELDCSTETQQAESGSKSVKLNFSIIIQGRYRTDKVRLWQCDW